MTSQDDLSRLGSLFVSVPEGCERVKANAKIAVRIFRTHYGCHLTHRTNDQILDGFMSPFRSRQSTQPQGENLHAVEVDKASTLSKDQSELQNNILSASSSYCDLYLPSLPPESSKYIREALSLHALNHVARSHPSRVFIKVLANI